MNPAPVADLNSTVSNALAYYHRQLNKSSSSSSSSNSQANNLIKEIETLLINDYVEDIGTYHYQVSNIYYSARQAVAKYGNNDDEFILPKDTYSDEHPYSYDLKFAKEIVAKFENMIAELDKPYYVILRLFSTLEEIFSQERIVQEDDYMDISSSEKNFYEEIVKELSRFSLDQLFQSINALYGSDISTLNKELFFNKFCRIEESNNSDLNFNEEQDNLGDESGAIFNGLLKTSFDEESYDDILKEEYEHEDDDKFESHFFSKDRFVKQNTGYQISSEEQDTIFQIINNPNLSYEDKKDFLSNMDLGEEALSYGLIALSGQAEADMSEI